MNREDAEAFNKLEVELSNLTVRVHNLEAALFFYAAMVSPALPPSIQTDIMSVLVELSEHSSKVGGFKDGVSTYASDPSDLPVTARPV